MAYLGNQPARNFISFERQVFTIVNSQTAYTLDHSVTNENDIRLVVNNVVQEPGSGKAYTASGTTLTLSAALVNGTDEMYCVFLGKAVGTVNAPAGSVSTSQLASDAVTEAKIADGAVESEHLNNNVISGQTELASAPASTDELLISDAGTLKRIDVSLVGGDNTPNFFATKTDGNQAINDNTTTQITFNNELIDSDSAYASNTFTVPSGEAGVYQVSTSVNFYDSDEKLRRSIVYLYKNDQDEIAHTMAFGSNDMHNITNTFSALLSLSAGDTLKVYAVFDSGDSGAGVVVSAGSAYETWFQAFKLV